MSELIQTQGVALDPVSGPALDSDYDRFRADVYALLGALLARAPDAELLAWLGALELDDSDDSAMHEAWQVLRLAAERCDVTQVGDEYHDLFIGIGRGELMPYGSWYLTGFLMEKPLVALRRDLAQLGFERQNDVREPEDHIAALCQVMAMLLDPAQQVPAAEARQFFNNHLRAWSGRLLQDLQQAKNAHFYSAVGRFGEVFLEQEALLFEA